MAQATEKQTQYLEDLITTQLEPLARLGGRWLGCSIEYRQAKYGDNPREWPRGREVRNTDAELEAQAYIDYLTSLKVGALSKAAASELIDALKGSRWTELALKAHFKREA